MMIVIGPLDVGDMVKFHCDSGYMMEGQPIMTCIEIPRETAINNYGANYLVDLLFKVLYGISCFPCIQKQYLITISFTQLIKYK